MSVVVATRDRAGRLPALLASLRAQSERRAELVVVDDGSTDATAAVLAGESQAAGVPLRVLRHAAGRGPAAARNAGWRAARAPLVAFIDDDCIAAPGWLEAGLRAWDGAPDRFVQGRTEPLPAEVDRLGPFSRTLRVRSLGPWFQTCNMFYPRALLERVQGFDEAAFPGLSAEDADLAWRCIETGASPVFEREAQVFHAVHELGPVGLLRVAWRWHEAVALMARHPARRRDVLVYRLFWKKSHYLLVRALIGLLLPRRLARLRFWCLAPLAPAYLERARAVDGPPWVAPYFLVHDAVELVAVVRGAWRARTPVI